MAFSHTFERYGWPWRFPWPRQVDHRQKAPTNEQLDWNKSPRFTMVNGWRHFDVPPHDFPRLVLNRLFQSMMTRRRKDSGFMIRDGRWPNTAEWWCIEYSLVTKAGKKILVPSHKMVIIAQQVSLHHFGVANANCCLIVSDSKGTLSFYRRHSPRLPPPP